MWRLGPVFLGKPAPISDVYIEARTTIGRLLDGLRLHAFVSMNSDAAVPACRCPDN